MKILSNKAYGEMIKEIQTLDRDLNDKEIKNGKLRSEISNLKEEILDWVKKYDNLQTKLKTKIGELNTKIASSKNKNMQLEDENRQLKEEQKSLLGAKGGYVKEINRLKKQIEELEEKLKESMTDKYLVKKLPAGRRPKSQTMKLTSHTVVSNITRKMHNNN